MNNILNQLLEDNEIKKLELLRVSLKLLDFKEEFHELNLANNFMKRTGYTFNKNDVVISINFFLSNDLKKINLIHLLYWDMYSNLLHVLKEKQFYKIYDFLERKIFNNSSIE